MVIKNERDYFESTRVHVTTSIPLEIHKLARENKISWNKALTFGIKFLLAEIDGGIDHDYPDNKLKRNRDKLIENLNYKEEIKEDVIKPTE